MEETNTVELKGVEIDANALEEAYNDLDGKTKYGFGVNDDGSVAIAGDGWDDPDVFIYANDEARFSTLIGKVEDALGTEMDFEKYLLEKVGIFERNTVSKISHDRYTITDVDGFTDDEMRNLSEDEGVELGSVSGKEYGDGTRMFVKDVR